MKQFKGKLIQDVPYVVLDTETTGLNVGLGDRVTEIAAIRYEGGKEVARVNQLVNPQRAIDPVAIEISGITDEDVAGMPLFSDIAEEVLAILPGAILVAHSAKFDANFLATELWLAGFDRGPKKPVVPNPWMCTLKLARECFFFGRNNLSSVAHQMNIPVNRAHRALNDVHTTAKVFERMIADLNKRNIKTAHDFFDAQGRPIFCPPPPDIKVPSLLKEAIESEQPVVISYSSRNGRRVTSEVVTPLYVIKQANEPHLIAYSHDYNQQKAYLLSQIKQVKPLSIEE